MSSPCSYKDNRLLWVRANSVEESVRRRERQVEQTKIKLGMQIDDKAFQACLLETQVWCIPNCKKKTSNDGLTFQVMLTKEHNKWNFEALQEIIEGPLLNAKRMEEAIKVSRFIRKLISFYYPFSHRFSDMTRVKVSI